MIVSNTESVPGREVVEVLGLVNGNIVQARNIGRDIQAGLRSVVGGKVGVYSEMLAEARAEATRLMVTEAEGLNADAVVNVRYTTSAISQGMSEILVYGTGGQAALGAPPTGSGAAPGRAYYL